MLRSVLAAACTFFVSSALIAACPQQREQPAEQSIFGENTVEASQLESTKDVRLIINNVDLSNPDTVHLLCSVIDNRGRHVIGLTPSSRSVWKTVVESIGDNSVTITDFSVEEVREHEAPPFSSVFIVDYSASMDKAITNVLMALSHASTLLRPGKDDFSVVQFDEHIHTPIVRATHASALDSLVPFIDMGGMTAVYGAAQRGLRDAALSPKNRVAILITDGIDNASLLSANDVVREAREAHARLYIIGMANADREILQQIATQTGARLFFPKESAELSTIFASIYRLNNSYYSISYARPKGENIRKTAVTLTMPDGSTVSDSRTYAAAPELIHEGRSFVIARFTESKMSINEAFDAETTQLVEYLRTHPEQLISVRAHTDTKGSHTLNDKLSRERARVLAEYLVQRGISRSQISSIQGMGKRMPLYTNDQTDPQLQLENRRGEVVLLERTTSLHNDNDSIRQ